MYYTETLCWKASPFVALPKLICRQRPQVVLYTQRMWVSLGGPFLHITHQALCSEPFPRCQPAERLLCEGNKG